MEQIGNLLSAQASVSDTPCTPPVAHVTLLTAAYLSQRQSVDDAFRGMKPVDPVLINNVGFFLSKFIVPSKTFLL